MRIRFAEEIKLDVAMAIHSFLVIVKTCRNFCKVQVDDKIAVTLWRRILANIQASEEGLELILLVDVILVFEHGDGKALAKSARPDIEEVHVGFFDVLDEWGLVYIVTIPLPDFLKVLHAVWDALAIDTLFSFSNHYLEIFLYCVAKLQLYFNKTKKWSIIFLRGAMEGV